MKQKEIISKENLKKLGFTDYDNDTFGCEYSHKDCPFIKVGSFMSVWHLQMSGIHSTYYAENSDTKTEYLLADFNPQNNARSKPHPELTTNAEILDIMLKWIEGARIYHQSIANELLKKSETIFLSKEKLV